MNTTTTITAEVSILETVSGEKIGRDPRRKTAAELNALGHFQQPMLQICKAKCLDCCAGDASEVRKCPLSDCANWPYRMGTNPFARRTLTDEERQARRERMLVARASRTASPVRIDAAVEFAE